MGVTDVYVQVHVHVYVKKRLKTGFLGFSNRSVAVPGGGDAFWPVNSSSIPMTGEIMRIRKLVLTLALLGVLAPLQVRAQGDTAQVTHRNVVSANPFLLLATWFNAEYEHRISDAASLGVRVSTFNTGIDDDLNLDDDDEADYASGRVFLRYYPSGVFRGFFFGVGGGLTNVDVTGDSHSVFGAGFDLGYNWLLGKKRNFYISIGVGADRLFGGDLGAASAFLPTFRVINIGFAF